MWVGGADTGPMIGLTMISMHRVVAALLLAVITGGGLAPVTCIGWEAAPSDRMACCQRAGHDCPDQAAADDCCAQQEQTHQPAATMSATVVDAPVAVPVGTVPVRDYPSLASAASDRRALPARFLHAPPGAFARPLRI